MTPYEFIKAGAAYAFDKKVRIDLGKPGLNLAFVFDRDGRTGVVIGSCSFSDLENPNVFDDNPLIAAIDDLLALAKIKLVSLGGEDA